MKAFVGNFPPIQIHHILYHASLFMGESATMASESAVLGTPAIYLDKVGRGYTDALEQKYGLAWNFTFSPDDLERALEKATEILSDEHAPAHYAQKRAALLEDTIDVNQLLIDKIENGEW